MKRFFLLMTVSTTIALAIPTLASAACRQQGDARFNAAKSVGTDFFYVSDGICGLGYVSSLNTYTSARVVTAPKQGKVTQDKPFHFIYKAPSGFKGEETFLIELCGERNGAKGCAPLKYTISTGA